MNLAEYQRRFVELSFAEQADEADFTCLGDPARFHLYRQMIRSRLLGMAKKAFVNTLEAVGSQAFEAAFARYLAQRPPKSPYIRDVIGDFAPFASEDAQLLAQGPVFTADLLRFEEAKWRVSYRARDLFLLAGGTARFDPLDGVRAFDFAGVPVLNPALEQLSLSHRVHELLQGTCQAQPCPLLVYRPPQHDDLRWYVPDALMARMLADARARPESTFAELVRGAAEALGKAVDEALLEELASGVTLALQRGVLLGSRVETPPSTAAASLDPLD